MRARSLLAALLVAIGMTAVGESTETRKDLDIYFLDMVGGASTLIVTPLGESVLIDTGSLEPKHRDADRIHAATQQAGLRRIDYLVTTHFHSDHFGGILELTNRIPVKRFMDKGHLPSERERKSATFAKLYPLYEQATGGKVRAIRAGDEIPLRKDPQGKIPPITLHCVAAEKAVEGFDGDVDAPASCHEIRKPDTSDNGRSIALVLRYGEFDFFAGGDITWNVEHRLACPKNIVGQVDVYQVTHHGLDASNNPLLVRALNPTVCIAMNGPTKGIQPNTFRALRALPEVKAIYQIHYNTQYGDEGNPPLEFIANGKDAEKGEFIRVSVGPDQKSFTVSIGADGPTRTYAVK